jgi:hypothetical protein
MLILRQINSNPYAVHEGKLVRLGPKGKKVQSVQWGLKAFRDRPDRKASKVIVACRVFRVFRVYKALKVPRAKLDPKEPLEKMVLMDTHLKKVWIIIPQMKKRNLSLKLKEKSQEI